MHFPNAAAIPYRSPLRSALRDSQAVELAGFPCFVEKFGRFAVYPFCLTRQKAAYQALTRITRNKDIIHSYLSGLQSAAYRHWFGFANTEKRLELGGWGGNFGFRNGEFDTPSDIYLPIVDPKNIFVKKRSFYKIV